MPRLVSFVTLILGLCCLFVGCNRQTDQPRIGITLNDFLMDGSELGPSINNHSIDSLRHLPPEMSIPRNPHHSTDERFVLAISGSSSQGQLTSDGICAALYAHYEADGIDVGIYGLEATTMGVANDREKRLKEIWAKNIDLDRARLHRKDLHLILTWHDGVSVESWDAINNEVVSRLGDPNANQ